MKSGKPRLADESIPAANRASKRMLLAICVGSAIERYDAFLFLTFSALISRLFFPTADHAMALFATVAAFSVSYMVRPLGALALSSYADRVSRRKALVAALSLMGCGTAMIALAPTYTEIGIVATILVVLGRFIQMFSLGGEYGVSTAMLTESVSEGNRGFYSSFNVAAIGYSSVFAGVTGLALNVFLSGPEIEAWGWRLPFLIGLLIIPIALKLRLSLPEPTTRKRAAQPLRLIFRYQKCLIILGIGAFSVITVSNITLAVYFPTYLMVNLGLPPATAFLSSLIVGAIVALFSPVFGALSDRIGRFQVMLPAGLTLLGLSFPTFVFLTDAPSNERMLIVGCVLGIALIAYQAPMPALLSELFPEDIRASGVAIVHDITATVLGALTPVVIVISIAAVGVKSSPGLMIMVFAALGCSCLIFLKRYQMAGCGPAIHPGR